MEPYCVSGTVLSALRVWTKITSYSFPGLVTIIIPILQRRKLGLQDIKQLLDVTVSIDRAATQIQTFWCQSPLLNTFNHSTQYFHSTGLLQRDQSIGF